MKKIIYQNNNVVFLTDSELKEALMVWNERQTFFCERSGEFLSPFFQLIKNCSESEVAAKESESLSDVSERRKL